MTGRNREVAIIVGSFCMSGACKLRSLLNGPSPSIPTAKPAARPTAALPAQPVPAACDARPAVQPGARPITMVKLDWVEKPAMWVKAIGPAGEPKWVPVSATVAFAPKLATELAVNLAAASPAAAQT